MITLKQTKMARSTYKSIAKANTIFGGVQIFNIFVGFVRTKIVAILLGPFGMGVLGLFQSTINLVKSATNMGLQTSAVREVSIAYETGNIEEIAKTKTIFSRIVWLTGMLGVLVTYLGAGYLSQLTFGTEEYIVHFRFLSIVLLLNQLTVEYNVLLQGMRQLKKLAMVNIVGSIVGLLINVPIFYIWGIDGIIPSLIVVAFSAYIVAYYNTRELRIPSVKVSFFNTYLKSKNMIQMGFLIGLTGFMDMASVYIVKVAIQNWGTIAEVGLYTAGFAVVQQYVNIVFSSISTDYFPRLCAASEKTTECTEIINKQFEILALCLLPLVICFISYSTPILHILYSSEFSSIKMMVCWIAFGMLFRAYSWCPGYLYLAKGDSRLYFLIYIVTFFVELTVYILLYKIMGLVGTGIGFVVNNVLGCISTVIITAIRYSFRYYVISCKLLLFSVLFSLIAILVNYIVSGWYCYILNSLIFIVSLVYSLYQLNDRLDLYELIKKRMNIL